MIMKTRLNQYIVARALGQMRLLDLAMMIAFAADYIVNLRDNRRFRARHTDFTFPPAKLIFNSLLTTKLREYYEGGIAGAQLIDSLAATYLPPGRIAVCDWGCGPARTIRQLPRINPERYAVVCGTDYREDVVNWCSQHIQEAQFELNGLRPPLPFPDNAFDFLYSLSVYTHLPIELQRDWLKENLRVVKPDGLVLLTTHGDAFRWRLLPHELAVYEEDGMVVRNLEMKYGWMAYHNPRFVKEQFLRGLDIIYSDVHETGPPYLQDVWVVRKPGG